MKTIRFVAAALGTVLSISAQASYISTEFSFTDFSVDYAEVFSTKEHCCYYGSGVINGTTLPYDRVFSVPSVPWGNGVDTLSTAPVGHSLQIRKL